MNPVGDCRNNESIDFTKSSQCLLFVSSNWIETMTSRKTLQVEFMSKEKQTFANAVVVLCGSWKDACSLTIVSEIQMLYKNYSDNL